MLALLLLQPAVLLQRCPAHSIAQPSVPSAACRGGDSIGCTGQWGRRAALAATVLGTLGYAPSARAATGLSRDEISAKLSRVPVFVVTNSKNDPYLTEIDAAGRRSGFFYIGPREALATLQEVRTVDPAASLSVVSLDSIWFDIPHTTAEAVEALATAPQPKAGTSTDVKLFSLVPLADEVERAAALQLAAQRPALAAGSLPLFYDPSLLLQVDGFQQRPYFFRAQDLNTTWAQANAGQEGAPTVRVTDVPELVLRLSRGDADGEPMPLLVAASEAAAVVDRMQRAPEQGEGAGRAPARAARELSPEEKLERLAVAAPFGGKKGGTSWLPFLP